MWGHLGCVKLNSETIPGVIEVEKPPGKPLSAKNGPRPFGPWENFSNLYIYKSVACGGTNYR